MKILSQVQRGVITLGWLIATLHWMWGPTFVTWIAWILLSLPFWELELEARIRGLGMVLQLFGFCLTAVGLLGTARKYVLPTAGNWIQEWWQSRPYAARRVSASGRVELGAMGVAATATVVRPQNASIDDRLLRLEQDVDRLEALFIAQTSDTRDQLGKLRSDLAGERKDRQAATNTLDVKITDLARSGLRLDAVGIVMFVFGVVLGTGSLEVCGLVAEQCGSR